jgi:predicted DNA-binding transcriptional regulator YafY
MPRSSNQKLKPLYLARILLERTDENNVLTAQGLIGALAAYGVPADRKSVYDDIDALRQFGLDVELRKGKGGGYFVAKRGFELPELKLLVDAALSSRFITVKKSRELIDKLSKLTSEAQAKELRRQVYVAGRVKALNETVYYSVDAIHAAINESRKISFKYFEYDVRKKRVYRKNGEAYVRTPIALCWNDENYSLITYNPKYEECFATYRVDRMVGVTALDEAADALDRADFSVSEYVKRAFGMYGGETLTARLVFDDSLVSVVLDHFGSGAQLEDLGGGRFCVEAEVSASPVFFGLMVQFGARAEIMEPQSLRTAMRNFLAEVGGQYDE